MSEYVLKTSDLTKQFGKYKALDNFNIEIKKGDIYALIGKNGAGKTTLIRIITGLASKTSGTVLLFDETNEKDNQKHGKKVGALVETPALNLDKTAYENLNINRKLKGIQNKDCIKDVLEIVGLSKGIRGKKVKHFSLGMRQRLGIAKALLGNPEFLILDEPINGLDPVGIIEMRELFLKLNKEHGVTILIASHILKELSLIATNYGVIDNGKIIDTFTSKELENKCEKYIKIKVDNIEKAKDVLTNVLEVKNFISTDEKEIKLFEYIDDTALVNKTLVTEGINVEEIISYREELETYFSRIVGGEGDE